MQPARGHQNKCCDSTCLVRLIFQSIFHRAFTLFSYFSNIAFLFSMRAIRAKVYEIRIVPVWSMRCIHMYIIYKLLYLCIFRNFTCRDRLPPNAHSVLFISYDHFYMSASYFHCAERILKRDSETYGTYLKIKY